MCMLCLCSCCASPLIVVVGVVIVTPPTSRFLHPLVLIVLMCLGDMCLGDVLGKALAPLHRRGVAEPGLLLGGVCGMHALIADID
jgi:hypothetical protein